MLVYWYDVGGRLAARASQAKLFRAWNLFEGTDTGDALIIIVTPVLDSNTGDAIDRLETFIRDLILNLRYCLRPNEIGDAKCASD